MSRRRFVSSDTFWIVVTVVAALVLVPVVLILVTLLSGSPVGLRFI